MSNLQTNECACGSSKLYEHCCGPIHFGQRKAETAEALMRSRYTAYALNKLSYIKKSMKGPAMQRYLESKMQGVQQPLNWQGLEILASETLSANKASVHFKAYYESNGSLGVLEENSLFVFEDGLWFYVDFC